MSLMLNGARRPIWKIHWTTAFYFDLFPFSWASFLKPTSRLGIRMVDETEISGSQADTRDSFICEK